jgi:hypothetical protein
LDDNRPARALHGLCPKRTSSRPNAIVIEVAGVAVIVQVTSSNRGHVTLRTVHADTGSAFPAKALRVPVVAERIRVPT